MDSCKTAAVKQKILIEKNYIRLYSYYKETIFREQHNGARFLFDSTEISSTFNHTPRPLWNNALQTIPSRNALIKAVINRTKPTWSNLFVYRSGLNLFSLCKTSKYWPAVMLPVCR